SQNDLSDAKAHGATRRCHPKMAARTWKDGQGKSPRRREVTSARAMSESRTTPSSGKEE
ncbi:hypothetical protein chiPu_0022526, partial [Chiloscyllium punctatum]|nr:hypothetical protein [Chiloscyllium punctatum]